MKKYEVIEDNGGGLTLVVFDTDGNVEYLHSGYEYSVGALQADIASLVEDDASTWDGNDEYPQVTYDDMTSDEYGWKIIADNDGIYPDEMGIAGCKEFGIEK